MSGPGTVAGSGAILASGGASASGNGGTGGEIEASGTAVKVGAATGGDGGAVTVTSSTPRSTLTGTISLRAGIGATAGEVGTLTVDGSALTLTNGRYKP